MVLEQGPRLSPADFEHDELKNWYLGGITNDAVRNPQTFRDDPAKKAELQKVRPALWYGRAVGGASLHYTANYWRFHEIDFIERSVLGAIAGTGFADWPITYADLEPYYTKVEWEIGVSGLAGASPFDPPRTKPYPMPPLPVKSSGVLLERGARKLGLHPFPAPMAINSQPYRGRPACVHCGFCHGFACEVVAKASTLTTVIPEAEATGRCEVRPDSYVARIETNKQGRATGVAYFDRESARAVSEGAGGGRVRQRRGNAAAAADVGERAVSARSGELERTRRQVPDVQLHVARARRVRARVERIQERAGHAHRPRLLRFGSEARPLRRRRARRAHRAAADDVGDSHRHRGPVVGQRLQGAAAGVPPQHAGRLSRHVARGRVEQRHARSGR